MNSWHLILLLFIINLVCTGFILLRAYLDVLKGINRKYETTSESVCFMILKICLPIMFFCLGLKLTKFMLI